MKLTLWLGTPSLVAFLASPYSGQIEAPLAMFMFALVVLVIGILPRLNK